MLRLEQNSTVRNKQILYRRLMLCSVTRREHHPENSGSQTGEHIKKFVTAHQWKLCLTDAYSAFKQVSDCVLVRT